MSADPLILAIEVSNPSADAPAPAPGAPADAVGPSVALARGPRIIDQEPLRTPDARHDDDLMPAIDRLVRRVGLSPRDIARVAVSIGPGGFTGLRVSIATAKALGEAIISRGGEAACCIGVPTALVAARGLHDAGGWPTVGAGTPARVAVALASKRETAFIAMFDGPDPGEPGELGDAQALERWHAQRPIGLLLADRFLPAPVRGGAARLGIEVRTPALSAAACARASERLAPVDPGLLVPLYPREPEAVTKWRALHPD